MAAVEEPIKPPDDVYIRQRWISSRRASWARDCDRILTEHGAVHGDLLFDKRYQARWRAQSLMKLLVGLRLRERWELSEHVEKTPGGYKWSVEYLGKHGN